LHLQPPARERSSRCCRNISSDHTRN